MTWNLQVSVERLYISHAFEHYLPLCCRLCLRWSIWLLLLQKHQTWKRKLKSQAEAFAHYRQTHTANERRRRNEMRGLFDKLKKVLGLLNLPKVSKCYILKQVGILGLKRGGESFNLDRVIMLI